jgi:hypothetical protein
MPTIKRSVEANRMAYSCMSFLVGSAEFIRVQRLVMLACADPLLVGVQSGAFVSVELFARFCTR